jgi:hypothetical protein
MKSAFVLVTGSTALAATAWAADGVGAKPFVGIAGVWIALIVVIVAAMSVITSRWYAGKHAGRRTRKIAEALLDRNTYHQLHDVILETKDGPVRIDHVIVSRFGVFVIEAMDIRGEILGKAFDPEWTQTAGGERITFQNPLRPNYNRKLALDGLLRVGEHKIFSVIAFTGGSKFQVEMPDNVTQGKDFVKYIKSKDTVLITDSEIQGIVDTIQAVRLKRPPATDRRTGRSGRQAGGPLRFMNLLKFAAIALAVTGGAHVLHNTTQFPSLPWDFNPVTWITGTTPPERIEITRTSPAKGDKAPRSNTHLILTLKAGQDTRLTLTDQESGRKVLSLELKKGESREIELKKGYYTAEILQAGNLRIKSVSAIGSTGSLEF